MIKRTFIINGVSRTVLVGENETLASFLRERLLLTGCKIGCGEGHCGACNVIVDGKVARSCIMKLSKIRENAEITTIEGIGTISDMHPLQVAWMAHGCAQCGFCSPGFIMTAKVLLDNNNAPTREEVRDWFQKNRNLCRCLFWMLFIRIIHSIWFSSFSCSVMPSATFICSTRVSNISRA